MRLHVLTSSGFRSRMQQQKFITHHPFKDNWKWELVFRWVCTLASHKFVASQCEGISQSPVIKRQLEAALLAAASGLCADHFFATEKLEMMVHVRHGTSRVHVERFHAFVRLCCWHLAFSGGKTQWRELIAAHVKKTESRHIVGIVLLDFDLGSWTVGMTNCTLTSCSFARQNAKPLTCQLSNKVIWIHNPFVGSRGKSRSSEPQSLGRIVK